MSARIRSIHPGFLKDPAMVSMSPYAILFLEGLWQEADDYGIFLWRPQQLLWEIAPAWGNLNPDELIAEVEANGWIRKFEHDGKIYGACKNFRRFQKPRRCVQKHPFPNQLLDFIGGEPVDFGTDTDIVVPCADNVRTPPDKVPSGDGERERESIPDGMGASAPLKPSDQVWKEGVPALIKAGADGPKLRSYIGKALRDHGAENVLMAVQAARDQGTGDPIPYIARCLRREPTIEEILNETQ